MDDRVTMLPVPCALFAATPCNGTQCAATGTVVRHRLWERDVQGLCVPLPVRYLFSCTASRATLTAAVRMAADWAITLSTYPKGRSTSFGTQT